MLTCWLLSVHTPPECWRTWMNAAISSVGYHTCAFQNVRCRSSDSPVWPPADEEDEEEEDDSDESEPDHPENSEVQPPAKRSKTWNTCGLRETGWRHCHTCLDCNWCQVISHMTRWSRFTCVWLTVYTRIKTKNKHFFKMWCAVCVFFSISWSLTSYHWRQVSSLRVQM